MSKRAIVIDDEPLAVKRLIRLLTKLDVVVVASGSSGHAAVQLCKLHAVDILFMDINMPGMDGLEAAQKIVADSTQAPAIVFCTAYNEHALDAFKAQAAAYLLKPVSVDDLSAAIKQASRLSQLQLGQLDAAERQALTIGIEHADHVERKSTDQILYFRAEDKIVLAGLVDGVEIVVDYTLKALTERLPGGFLRVHRNSLLNKFYLSQMKRDSAGQVWVTLNQGEQTFVVSRRHASAVKKYFA